MKKLILFSVAITCVSISASFAQTPTKANTDSVGSQAPYESKENKMFQKDMVKLMPSDVPEKIMSTLKSEKYKGWEKGGVSRSSDGQVYMLTIGKGSEAKEYRFDAEGNVVPN